MLRTYPHLLLKVHEVTMKSYKRAGNRDPMSIFRKRLILEQIDEYAGYVYLKNAHTAGAHRALLLRFAKDARLDCVGDITKDKVSFFIGGELTGYYSLEALKAIRSFLRFSKRVGYNCMGYNEIRTEAYLTPAGKPRLSIEEMPYSKIQAALSRGIYKGVQRA